MKLTKENINEWKMSFEKKMTSIALEDGCPPMSEFDCFGNKSDAQILKKYKGKDSLKVPFSEYVPIYAD